MYKSPAVRLPNLSQLNDISEDLGLQLTNTELEQYQAHFQSDLQAVYQRVSEIPEPTLPVKYPRTPGYRPAPEDNPYNAWYWRCEIKGASSGKLCGKTIAIKDSIAVAGVPMMYGSKLMEGYTPEFDATVVTRILDAGGKITGKAACEDLCCSGSSFTASTGPVLNPRDKTRSAGGSSCGSAALLAGDIIDLSIANDVGGSSRIPASYCGLVAIKPTYGLVPCSGAASWDASADYLCPMAKNVTDCATMLEVVAGPDSIDGRQQIFYTTPEYSKLLSDDLSGVKIGFLDEGFEGCESDVVEVVKATEAIFTKAGATVEYTSVLPHRDGKAIWKALVFEGLYMASYHGCYTNYRGFYPTSMLDHYRTSKKTRAQDLPFNSKMICLWGEYQRRFYNSRFYGKAQNLVRYLTNGYDEALSKYDVLVMPTLPTKAHKIPDATTQPPDLIKVSLGMAKNTAPFNLTGHPTLTINAGYSDHLPIGVMIVGKPYDDATVLKVAKAFETKTTKA